MNRYQSLNEQHIQALQNIVGVEHTLTDKAIGLEYAQDAATKNRNRFSHIIRKSLFYQKLQQKFRELLNLPMRKKYQSYQGAAAVVWLADLCQFMGAFCWIWAE